MKKVIFWIFVWFILALPSSRSAPVLENGSFAFSTASTWTDPNVVYVEINISSINPSSRYVIYNISKTSRCEATICQIFNTTQTDPSNTPAATGSFIGNDCLIVGGFTAMYGEKYKLAVKGIGVDWYSWHDASTRLPKAGDLIKWVNGGYGVPGSGWTAQAQSRCINSLWGEELSIAHANQKTKWILMIIFVLLIIFGAYSFIGKLYFKITGR